MSLSFSPKIWVLADPKVGTSSQAVGIAEALGWPFEIKNIKYNSLAKLPNFILGNSLLGVDKKESANLEAPFPEIIISAGRRTAPIARYIKQKSGGKSFLIHIMEPETPYHHYDLVLLPEHDQNSQNNPQNKNNSAVHFTLGSPHRITPEKLATAAANWQNKFEELPDPKIAVLVGGNTNGKIFTPSQATELAMKSTALATALDGSLLITTSRRTNSNAIDAMKSVINCPYHLYDWRAPSFKENPYLGFLGMATAIVVTGDSISMVSEAVATGKPVFIFSPEELVPKKFKIFHEKLYAKGYAKKLGSTLRLWEYNKPQIMQEIVDKIKEKLNISQEQNI